MLFRSVAKLGDGRIVALGRAGWPAQSSKYEQHQRFAGWVRRHHDQFDELLAPGERAVGEWLLQAHGTRYALFHEPFVLFDIIRQPEQVVIGAPMDRLLHHVVEERAKRCGLTMPTVLRRGDYGVSIKLAEFLLGENGWHGAVDQAEGAVWRVEREGRVDFLAKYVRPTKVDGKFLPEVSGHPIVWNWRVE